MAGYVTCILITVVMPVFLAVTICARIKTVRPAILGVLCFLASQVFTRLPILQHILPKSASYTVFQIKHPFYYMLILALSAGVFEECGRWIFMRAGKIEDAINGIVFGICHGGVEAILFVGIPALRLPFISKNEWNATASHLPLAAAERAFAIMAHIGLSVLVLSGVERKRKPLLVLAILLHSMLDFSAVYTAATGISGWTIETMLALYAVGILLLSSYVYVKGKGHVANETM